MARKKATAQEHRLIIAGFGGQGVLTVGKLLCTAAMHEGKQVSYLPSYGSEVRGGTANCHLIISSTEIFSPVVETADSLIILNEQSFERFGKMLRAGGVLVLNTSLVKASPSRGLDKSTIVSVPATEKAAEIGSVLAANMMMLGAFVAATSLCGRDSAEAAIRDSLTGAKSEVLPVNLQAFQMGMDIGAAARSKR